MFRISIIFTALLGAASVAASAQDYSYERSNDAERYSRSGSRFEPTYVEQGKYRQPVSMLVADGEHALITTRLSGEVYQFNLHDHSVEVVLSSPNRQWGQIIPIGEKQLAIADTKNDEVVILALDMANKRWMERAAVSVPGRPHSLEFDPIKSQLWVSSTWGQRLHRFQVESDSGPILHSLETIDLPMCGGRVLCLPKHDAVLVADAFGCHFVVIEQAAGTIVNHGQLDEHNLCDFAIVDGGAAVLFPQQLLIDLVPAVQGQITWGNFLSNNLRRIQTKRLIKTSGDYIYVDSKIVSLGRVGNGSGDPTSVAVSCLGKYATTIGGTNQVALGSLDGGSLAFVDVGLHPVDCEFTPDGTTLVVINQFSDSLTIVDMETSQAQHVSLGDLRPPTKLERGEQLFHDSSLSHDGWMSCQSCHVGGHTNGLLTDNFTDKSYQTPKRVLSLLGQAETAPYSWAGNVETLEEQIAFSIKSTMASDNSVREQDVEHLAEFVRSLQRPPSLIAARSDRPLSKSAAKQIRRGQEFFVSAGCAECHREPHYTSRETYDVGLHDEESMREFNPPSLNAVSQRQNSLFHDSRSKSIRDVVFKENHQMPDNATDRQRRDLVQFLMSL